MTPIDGVLLFSLGLSFAMAVLYRLLINPADIRKLKLELAFYRKKVSKAQKAGDKAEVDKFTSQMLKASQAQFKFTMKPLFVSMIIFIFAISWLSSTYADIIIAMPFALPFIGAQLNWFWWYLIITMPATFIFRKALGVE